jgi:hypothetical protein
MNTSSTPPRTGLRFLAPSGEPGAPHEQEPEQQQDTEDERDAQQGRYANLPGRAPIDLEALSDLSLD